MSFRTSKTVRLLFVMRFILIGLILLISLTNIEDNNTYLLIIIGGIATLACIINTAALFRGVSGVFPFSSIIFALVAVYCFARIGL